MQYGLYLLTYGLVLFDLLGCGKESASQTASVADLSQLSGLFDQYTKVLKTPVFTSGMATLQTFDYTTLYSSLASRLDNNVHSIGSYQFRDQLKMTLSLKDAYQQVHDQYGSIGKYWKALGVDPIGSVSLGEYNDGLATIERSQQAWELGQAVALSHEDLALVVKAQVVTLAVETGKLSGSSSLGLLDTWCILTIGQCGNNNQQNNNIAVNLNIGLVAGQVAGNFSGNNVASSNNIASNNGNNNGNGNAANNANGNGMNNHGQNGGSSGGTNSGSSSSSGGGNNGGSSSGTGGSPPPRRNNW